MKNSKPFDDLHIDEAWDALAGLDAPELPDGMEDRFWKRFAEEETEQAWDALAKLEAPELPDGMEERFWNRFTEHQVEEAWEQIAILEAPELPDGMEDRFWKRFEETYATEEKKRQQRADWLQRVQNFFLSPFRFALAGAAVAACVLVFVQNTNHVETNTIANHQKNKNTKTTNPNDNKQISTPAMNPTVIAKRVEEHEVSKNLDLYKNLDLLQHLDVLENFDAIQQMPDKG